MATVSASDATSRWQHRIATITTSTKESVRLNYIDCASPSSVDSKGVILLIHGFPQTSRQFRHVITPISDAGYRVIAPDYRGAGQSSKPAAGYEKSQMAEDLHLLIHTQLEISGKIHIVGHDIGGMIAFAYASRYPEDVASLIWGECPLPGTNVYEQVKGSPDAFHFLFHRILDLPEALIAGRERIYCKHFFDKQSYNSAAITDEDLDHYALAYSQPGAIRAGLEVYRTFEQDAKENREWVSKNGKLRVPTLGMVGKEFVIAPHAETMLGEMHEQAEVLIVEGSGHYIAEENPEAFVEGVLGFVGKHTAGR
ncbi:soluble epoxide hydrolase [Melanomma pulvis-pyrius CBS 109.77]|uniref:Soluble epoxide hydrolase n=1 Tax=Melanomma pulvis-pyrius CBS 109.77 TaxID=1314802 RepID=A0A6A6X6Z5_9PLEO|nr:soluble epoxide hydrolase [Melanomma pulvis-pyrius CBS 109.77]